MKSLAILVALIGLASSASAAGASLEGRWLVEDIRGGGVIDRLQTTLEIASDGKISGMAGCNRYFGTASIDAAAIGIGPVGATRMACPPAIMSQEQAFLGALADARAWRIDETGKLVLTDFDGATVLRLAPID